MQCTLQFARLGTIGDVEGSAMFKRDDLVSFKREGLPLKVRALHDIHGLMWIEAADAKGNRTFGTEESFRSFNLGEHKAS